MKCEIIQDLLPSYKDGLTSNESNNCIENHLKECAECREYLQNMEEDVLGEEELTVQDTQINPFLKIRKALRKKIFIAILTTVFFLILISGLYISYLHKGRRAYSDEVKMVYEQSEGLTQIRFVPQNDKAELFVSYHENEEINGILPLKTISIMRYPDNPFKDNISELYHGLLFVDENTIIDLYTAPSVEEFDEDSVLVIKFLDKTVLLNLNKLYKGQYSDDLSSK